MVALSRCLAVSLALLGDAARVAKKRGDESQNTKFISGVPVYNYHAGALEETQEGDWIVFMKPGREDMVSRVCAAYKKGCKRSGSKVPFLDIRGTETELAAVIEASHGAVEFAEADQMLHMIPELDADQDSASWGLDRVGAGGRGGNEGAGVSIFILDTGVRTTHTDFTGRAVPEADFSNGNQVCNGDLQCAADRQGHGTHCAGTAGGKTFGVAPSAKIHGVKCLGDNGAGSLGGIIGSIDYVAAAPERPAVGSMSLGGQCPFGWCFLYRAIETAIDQAVASGATIVVAGGNSNADACGFMPAFVPSAITVGATNSNDARASFSNYGSCTNLWAPGRDIPSATHENDTGSKTFSGTSMACPHVAGGAALILELNPGFSASKVLERLQANAATNYITDLKNGDTNKLLYIASDAPPPVGGVP